MIIALMSVTMLMSASSCEEEVKLKQQEDKQVEKIKKEILNETIFCKGRIVLNNSLDHRLNVYVIKYDNCEYLVCSSNTNDSRGGTSVTIEHSASCKNPIHPQNKDDL